MIHAAALVEEVNNHGQGNVTTPPRAMAGKNVMVMTEKKETAKTMGVLVSCVNGQLINSGFA